MTRIARATVSYPGGVGGPARAAALTREALAMVAARLPPGATRRVGLLRVDLRVGRGAVPASIAERIAEAIARRL
jgi:hypothetical protein